VTLPLSRRSNNVSIFNKEQYHVWKFVNCFGCEPGFSLPAIASDRSNDVGRIEKATQAFQEIVGAPTPGIPKELLEAATCIAIFPGTDKPAYIFGAKYGKGLASCRTAGGWSAPLFLALGGSGGTGTGGESSGFQIGGTISDVVMLFMNDHALQSLMSDKFTIGADATVAAGPVGRDSVSASEVKADILSYTRSKGTLEGFSLDGAVVQADDSGDKAIYGAKGSRQDIVNGKVAVPNSAQKLAAGLVKYASHDLAASHD
jgi:lipid-binding SYLF domain-containing protein